MVSEDLLPSSVLLATHAIHITLIGVSCLAGVMEAVKFKYFPEDFFLHYFKLSYSTEESRKFRTGQLKSGYESEVHLES
jgi:hypothetical protein